MRKSLADIYQKMLKEHPNVMKKDFKLDSYGMDENSETFKKLFPDTFKRRFMRLCDSVGDPRKARRTEFKKVKKQFKTMPPNFIISAGLKRCTMHDTSCPVEPCPYISANKKIVMIRSLKHEHLKNTSSAAE